MAQVKPQDKEHVNTGNPRIVRILGQTGTALFEKTNYKFD